MVQWRKGLRSKLRGVTEEEYADLCECADIRRSMTDEEKDQAGSPDVADSSFVAAGLWASFTLWQDHPKFVFLGLLALTVNFGHKIYTIGLHLLS